MEQVAANTREVLDSIADGILIIDIEYRIVFANKAMLALCGGLQTADFAGRKCHEIFHGCPSPCAEKCLSVVLCPHDEIFRSGEATAVIHRHLMPDNTEKTFSISASPLRDKAGNIIMIIEALRDITEQKQAEEALKKSEAFNRSILESVGEGFVVIDRNYRIISANKAYCAQEHCSAQEIIGNYCYRCSHNSDNPCYEFGEECAPRQTFETGEAHMALHVHQDKEGQRVYVEIRSFPLKDASGEVTAVIEVLNDITEKRYLESQLRHAQKMEAIGTLAGGVAHDFNNILNVIIGYGVMALDRLKDDPISKDHLNEILAAAERAATLTKRLLAFSRKQAIELRPADVNEIILGIKKMLSRIIGEDITFTTDLIDNKMTVMADVDQIDQVLMNLAGNARDAMPKGGLLSISTGLREIDAEFIARYGYGKPGMYALISVTDTGVGMDKETQKKIFEPFFTTKGIGEGTGLGLSISYGIVKQHLGYLKVYSEVGKGTTFKILLPLVEKEALEPRQVKSIPPSGGKETILLAEDEPSLRKLMKIVLESFGYSVIAAEDGEDAISKFMENKDSIQLIILDLIMPNKSGKKAYEAITKTSPDIKTLFVSGYTADIIKREEIFKEELNFINKPVLPKDLLNKVREILDR